jgi:hypothetical protein
MGTCASPILMTFLVRYERDHHRGTDKHVYAGK